MIRGERFFRQKNQAKEDDIEGIELKKRGRRKPPNLKEVTEAKEKFVKAYRQLIEGILESQAKLTVLLSNNSNKEFTIAECNQINTLREEIRSLGLTLQKSDFDKNLESITQIEQKLTSANQPDAQAVNSTPKAR